MAINLDEGSPAYRLLRATTAFVSHTYAMVYSDADSDLSAAMQDNRCIETSRALQQSLDMLGIPARLLPVDILVSNPPAYELRQKYVPISQWPPHAWSLGVHADQDTPESTGWNGHMVVRIAKRWLADANSGQFHRPGLVHMQPFWVLDYPADTWKADKDAWSIHGLSSPDAPDPNHPNYPLIQMRQRPNNVGWKRGTAATTDITPMVDATVLAMGRLRDGTLPDTIGITAADGDMVVVDMTSIIERYNRT